MIPETLLRLLFHLQVRQRLTRSSAVLSLARAAGSLSSTSEGEREANNSLLPFEFRLVTRLQPHCDIDLFTSLSTRSPLAAMQSGRTPGMHSPFPSVLLVLCGGVGGGGEGMRRAVPKGIGGGGGQSTSTRWALGGDGERRLWRGQVEATKTMRV